MKLRNLIYTAFFLIFAISCKESVLEPETLKSTAPQLKSATIGANYYVSTKGSDSNPGTQTLPFLTIAYAASLANPGDVITVENGTYTTGPGGTFASLTRSGTSDAYITYKARNIGGAILDGQSGNTLRGFNVTGNYINIEGFEMKGTVERFFVISGTHINIRDIHAHNNGGTCTDTTDSFSACSVTSTANTVLFERCTFNDIGRLGPGEGGCTPTTNNYKEHDHAIYCSGATNLTVQNCVFYNIHHGFALQVYSGVGATSTNVKFINNTCENGNAYTPAGHIILWGSLNGALIANNIFKDQYQYAIQVYPTGYTYSNVLITNNITGGGNGIISTGTAMGVTIANNCNNTDPLFVSELTHNFSLQVNSPATVVGYNTSLLTDYLKDARTIINIGAYASTTVLTPTAFYNTQISAAATKNSCGAGYTGSAVTYTVAAKKYNSTVSQVDADNKALADLNNNKQAYANTNGTCTAISATTYYNTQVSATATKNSCGTGYTGSTVTYTVPAKKYSSTVSQVDADNKALADLNNNKQAYANTNGTCTAIPKTTYYNTQASASATKNSCGTGYTGSTVTYTVAAKKYSSTVSQVDADNKALADLNNNKQAYANTNGTCTAISATTYYNTQVSATATKNSCGTGYTGSTVTYTVPAKKYSSTVSQSDADSKALADLTSNKQAYANTNGTCTAIPKTTYYNTRVSATATKNSCGPGYIGSRVTYTVSAGKYTSTSSQADANAKASSDLSKNAQSYANLNGTCTQIKRWRH